MPALSRHFWLLENIRHDDGAGFSAELPSDMPAGDSDGEPSKSSLVLFEDNVRLGAPHSLHDDIRRIGKGRYSHWGNALFFSSSDNADPRQTGRNYVVVSEKRSSSSTRQAIDALENLPPDFSRNEAYRAVERCLALIDPLAKIGEDEKSFWRDKAFIEAYETFEGRNYRALERKYVVFNLVRALAHVPGDLAECGVFNGATSYFMALARSQSDRARRLHLFDSFEGLSAPDPRDGTHWRAGDLSCSLDDVAAKMRGFDHINFYPGWIPTQFHRVADKSFSFVHIDVDLHAPTADSIEFFYPRLSPGGMLLCDDYGFSTCPGATEAMDEFFKTKPERVIHLPTGQGLVIKAPSP